MNAPWLAATLWHYSLQVAIVGAVLGGALALLRVAEPGLRLWALRAALMASLTIPVLAAGLAGASRSAPTPKDMTVHGGTVAGRAVGVAATAAPPVALAAPALLIAVVALGGLARLAWLAVGVRRLRSGPRVSPSPALAAEVEALQHALGTRALVEWRDDLMQPSTTGLHPPRVYLPEALAREPAARRRAVVCHELLHVRRGDWAHVVYEEAIRTAFWFHPTVRWLIGELRLAREQVVDREVVGFTRERRHYLDVLLSYADARTTRAPRPALSFFGRRQLERRIRSLVLEVRMSRLHKLGAALAALTLGAGATAVAAYAFPLTAPAATPDARQAAPPAARVGTVDALTMPAVVTRAAIAYPASLEGVALDGRVTVRLVLDASGSVSAATVVAAATQPTSVEAAGIEATTVATVVREMGESAVAALKAWKFEPPATAPLGFDITVAFTRANVPRAADWTPLAEPASSDKLAIAVASTAVRDASRPAGVRRATPGEETMPKLLHEVNAAYPAAAKAAGVEGTVELEVVIGTDGRIAEARVVQSVAALDRAALDAVRQWRFNPGLVDGKPVPVSVRLSVRFALK